MANLTGWQAVAREIGDYVCGNEEGIILPGEGSIPGAEHYPPDTPLVGHWLPAEAAAKEILRLRSQVVEGYARCRGIAQGIIDCIGSIGPEDAEGAAARACAEIQRLRERLAVLEKVRVAAENLDPADGSEDLSEALDAAERQQETDR